MGAAASLAGLLRARGASQRAIARRIVERGLPWREWAERFNATYRTAPERGERAARALEAAAAARHDDHAVARLRAMRGSALQRTGSPAEASRLLLEAEPSLAAAGDHERAAQALVLAVDALGHAGEIGAALRCARRASGRIRGPRARLWRAFLRANRANVLRLAGRLDEAARESDAAARTLDALGQAPSAAAARMNAGVALMYAGRVERARRRFEAAQAAFEAAGHADRALEVRYNLGCLDVRSGALGRGIRTLEALAADYAARSLERRVALCRMDLSDGLRRAGDLRGAAGQARQAARLFRLQGADAEAVEALWLAAAAAAPYDVDAAEAHVAAAQERATALGRPEFVLRSEVLRQDLALRRGEPLDGRRLAHLRRRAERLGQDEIAAEVQLLSADAALARGRRARARATLQDLPRAARTHPWLRAAAHTATARVEIAAGELGRAIRRLRALTRKLDEIRSELPGAWLRTMFLFERLDPYLALVDALLLRGRAADRRSAEEVLDAIAVKRFLQGPRPRVASARLGTLRRRLELLYDRLAEGSGPTRGVNPAQRVALLGEVRRLERAIADAWRAGERRGARHAAPPATARARAPSAQAAFAHVWVQGGTVRALVRHAGNVHDAGDLGGVAALAKRTLELSFHARRVRLTGSAHARAACADALEQLAAAVLPPLELPPTGTDLRLVLDPRLPDVPWEALPTADGTPLAAAHALARLPAVRLPRRPHRRGRGATVVAAGEEDLAGVLREALHVGRRATLLRGPQARREAVLAALGKRRVVHLAMHGVAAPNAPALGGVRLADGWFSAADVPARVAADLVSLAACQTGTPPGAAGRAWGALPRTLLRAGARWVLWTSEDVDDETTADLMSEFHPIRDMHRVPERFGRALERVRDRRGTAAGLLPFRLSGGRA